MNKTVAKTNNDLTTNEPSSPNSRPKIRLPYDYDEQKLYSTSTSLTTGILTPTLQSEAVDCDINYIVKRAEQTGILASKHMNPQQAQYGEFYDAKDFKEAMDIVRDAESQFAALPASLRAEFNNDPAQFLAGLDDPKTQQKLIDLGLATAPLNEKIENNQPSIPAIPSETPAKAPKGS